MDIFFEIHQGLPREGPGSDECTRKAYVCLKELPGEPYILDIGCGPGAQTVELAKRTTGKILALDNHAPFLEQLNCRAQREGVDDKIKTLEESMFNMSFEERSFDVIWSEGAIFIIGFEKGLREWKKFVKQDGYMVVSELSWIKSDPPGPLRDYWQKTWPQIKTIEGNIDIIERLGYQFVEYFIVPESGWWDEYYNPIEEKMGDLRSRYKNDPEATATLDEMQLEIEMYRGYSEYYGNVFYIMRN